MTRLLHVEIKFDLICPWCWIGKHNLDAALGLVRRKIPNLTVQKNWRGVQLLPDTPPEGLPFERFYLERLGSESAVRLRQRQVNDAASLAGLRVNFDRIKTFPNSGKAHRVLQFLKLNGNSAQYEAALENLFEEYFIDGKNIGDEKVLLDIAKNLHLNTASISAACAGSARIEAQMPLHSGVPHFRFNGKHDVFGAQSPEILAPAILSFIHENPSHDVPLSTTK